MVHFNRRTLMVKGEKKTLIKKIHLTSPKKFKQWDSTHGINSHGGEKLLSTDQEEDGYGGQEHVQEETETQNTTFSIQVKFHR